jgi:hypothetical protein
MTEFTPGPRFIVSLQDGILLTADQLEQLTRIIRHTERLNTKYVGKSVEGAKDGYIKELVDTQINDSMTLRILPEEDYTAYRFLAANASNSI